MEVKIMSQAGPEKRTIKATCEQRLPQSTAQAPGFYGSKIPSKHRVGRGPWSSHVGTPPPVYVEGHVRQFKCMQKDGFREQRCRLVRKEVLLVPLSCHFFFFYEARDPICNFIMQPNIHYKVLSLNPS